MKTKLLYIPIFVLITLVFNACLPEDISYDEMLLIGKWQSGTVFYRYNSDYSGVTWDTSEDVHEEEGSVFTWSLEKSELTHNIVVLVGGTSVTKIYTVTKLTETALEYKDDYGTSHSFVKVE